MKITRIEIDGISYDISDADAQQKILELLADMELIKAENQQLRDDVNSLGWVEYD